MSEVPIKKIGAQNHPKSSTFQSPFFEQEKSRIFPRGWNMLKPLTPGAQEDFAAEIWHGLCHIPEEHWRLQAFGVAAKLGC